MRCQMHNAKIENLFNLALDATPAEREQSLNLGTGYFPPEQSWEVIVRFVGNGLQQVAGLLVMQGYAAYVFKITELDNSYAILRLPESMIEAVADLDEIIYMEKPKRLFFQRTAGKRACCCR